MTQTPQETQQEAIVILTRTDTLKKHYSGEDNLLDPDPESLKKSSVRILYTTETPQQNIEVPQQVDAPVQQTAQTAQPEQTQAPKARVQAELEL